MSYIYIALTILFTLYGQMVLKWQVGLNPALSISSGKPLSVMVAILTNIWVLSGFLAAFLASLFWIAALGKLPISQAYPFTALSFPLIAILSWLIFGETISVAKTVGTGFVCIGIIIMARS